MKKISLSLLLLVSFSFAANAQWYKLKAYINPFIGDSCTTKSYPVLPIVAGNGVIAYGGLTGPVISPYCLNGTGDSEDLLVSKDDLVSCKYGYSDGSGGSGNIFAIASKNDSTFCFLYWGSYSSDSTIFTYTNNDFTTHKKTNIGAPIGYGPPLPTCFSNNFIYTIWQNSVYSNNDSLLGDTLITSRISLFNFNSNEYQIIKYVSPTHIYFTSDSTGYMLCTYRNDSAKSVLATTKDSGKTWTDSYLDSVKTITAFCFPSANTGYLTKSNGEVFKTTNAGATWTKLNNATSGNRINCISFSNDSSGYIGIDLGILYYTTNGGISWTMSISHDSYNVTSLYTFGTVVYFIDANQNIYKNESPMGIEKLTAENAMVSVYPNPSGNGKFHLQITNYESGITNVEVYNVLGEKIYGKAFRQAQGDNEIDLGSQSNGIYFYKIISEKGEYIASGKLAIQK